MVSAKDKDKAVTVKAEDKIVTAVVLDSQTNQPIPQATIELTDVPANNMDFEAFSEALELMIAYLQRHSLSIFEIYDS